MTQQEQDRKAAGQESVAAIVVHHRSYNTLPVTVAGLLSQGLRAERIIVVDNSEEPHRQDHARATLPGGVTLIFTPNRGYGAAVNLALDILTGDEWAGIEFVLVASHEAVAAPGSVSALQQALKDNPEASVAGPTLLTHKGERPAIWSQGGYLAAFTHQPRHHGYGRTPGRERRVRPVSRTWMDGAFLLYRLTELQRFRFCEEYFLYMEETDLHLRMRLAGNQILWVPNASAWQSSRGIPPYLFARNLRLLFARTDSRWRFAHIAPLLILQRALKTLISGGGYSDLRALLSGSRASISFRSVATEERVLVVINPLRAALAHYEAELVSVFEDGVTVNRVGAAEPSSSGRARSSWVAEYLLLLIKAAYRTRLGRRGDVLVTWPVLGLWDLLLIRLTAGRRGSLIVHDPIPLVRSRGYGRVARRIAPVLGQGVRVIVHSEAAERDVNSLIRNVNIIRLPHPILPARTYTGARRDTDPPTVRVLGQYKPERDTDALTTLATAISSAALLEIHGRGWPAVTGWRVFEGFLSETELDLVIATSSVVLIPYRRFYQSGIAIRCLELGTPPVGPRESVLSDILGQASPLLVDHPGDWARASLQAIQSGATEAASARERLRAKCIVEWNVWIAER